MVTNRNSTNVTDNNEVVVQQHRRHQQQQHHHHHHHHHHHSQSSPMSTLECQAESSLATPLLRYDDNNEESGVGLLPQAVQIDPSIATTASSTNSYPQASSTADISLAPTATTTASTSTEVRRRPVATATLQHQEQSDRTQATTSSEQQRILDRDGGFFQSRGNWSVERLSRKEARIGLGLGPGLCPCTMRRRGRGSSNSRDCCAGWFFRKICPFRLQKPWDDWFHTLAYKPTWVLVLILFLSYTLIVILFAYLYYALSVFGASVKETPDGSIIKVAFCDMDINSAISAMYFSLSTMTTIGYGVSDYYFGDCYTPFIVVLFQACCAITFDAVAVGLLFQRISRGTLRGKTIIFSNHAIVRRVKGIPYLMFRIAELRKHQLVEANVRVYCIRHERYLIQQQQQRQPHRHDDNGSNNTEGNNDSATSSNNNNNASANNNNNNVETVHFVTRNMKLLHPADETVGSHILMCLPQVIVHRLDENSPLLPSSPVWYDKRGASHGTTTTFSSTTTVQKRETVTETNSSISHSLEDTSIAGDRYYSSPSTTTPSKKCSVCGETSVKSRVSSGSTNTGRNRSSLQNPTVASIASRAKISPLPKRRSHPHLPQQQQEEQNTITTTVEKNHTSDLSGIVHNNEDIKAFLQDREVEIVVLVEGTDELTGMATQTKHSYTYNDFKWDHTFQPCIFSASEMEEENNNNQSENASTGRCRTCCFCLCRVCCCCCCCCCSHRPVTRGGRQARYARGCNNDDEPVCVVDFSKFHNTTEVPLDCEVCPYLP